MRWRRPQRMLHPVPIAMPTAANRVRSRLTCMPSIWAASTASFSAWDSVLRSGELRHTQLESNRPWSRRAPATGSPAFRQAGVEQLQAELVRVVLDNLGNVPLKRCLRGCWPRGPAPLARAGAPKTFRLIGIVEGRATPPRYDEMPTVRSGSGCPCCCASRWCRWRPESARSCPASRSLASRRRIRHYHRNVHD